jgi:hypothetical protein
VYLENEAAKLRQGDVYAAHNVAFYCNLLGCSYEELGTNRPEVLAGLRAMVAALRNDGVLVRNCERLRKLTLLGFSYEELGVTAADLDAIRFAVGIWADGCVTDLRQGRLHWYNRYWRISRIAEAIESQWVPMHELGITLDELQRWYDDVMHHAVQAALEQSGQGLQLISYELTEQEVMAIRLVARPTPERLGVSAQQLAGLVQAAEQYASLNAELDMAEADADTTEH